MFLLLFAFREHRVLRVQSRRNLVKRKEHREPQQFLFLFLFFSFALGNRTLGGCKRLHNLLLLLIRLAKVAVVRQSVTIHPAYQIITTASQKQRPTRLCNISRRINRRARTTMPPTPSVCRRCLEISSRENNSTSAMCVCVCVCACTYVC